jgi:cob(I)alamin adenosyltransferase
LPSLYLRKAWNAGPMGHERLPFLSTLAHPSHLVYLTNLPLLWRLWDLWRFPCRSLLPEVHGSARAYPSGMPRIYTKKGDDGTTGLLYGGRVSKADPVTEAYGTVDESVAAIGLARALSERAALAEGLLEIQRQLFVVGADLAANPAERARLEPNVSLVTDTMVERLETWIDELVTAHPLPNAFVVPGANPASAGLDVARAVVRRAERRVIELRDGGAEVSDVVLRYLNRLSDLLFVLARVEAGETEPTSRDAGP